MATLKKQSVLKSIDIDIETGNVSLKWVNRIVEETGDRSEVLYESPHRKVIAKDDIDTLNADIPDPILRADIKKIAKWTR